MIAYGLCLMGGCFAQNAQTQTLDSYWPAEKIDISRDEILVVVRGVISGGDSTNDRCSMRASVDFLDPPAQIVAGTIPFGYANAKGPNGGWIMSGVYLTTHSNSISFQYANQVVSTQLFSAQVDVSAETGMCSWQINGVKSVEMSDSFQLADDATRNWLLRSGQIRFFSHMAYSNERTRIRWTLRAMQSSSSAKALWSSDLDTLTEI